MMPRMKNPKFILLAVAVTAIVAGCCPCRKLKIQQEAKDLVGIEWKMIQYRGSSFETREGYTITFDAEKKITGVGDCNRLNGNYVINDDGTLKIDLLVSTRMMCLDQPQEDEFFKALQAVDSWQVDGTLLMLFTQGELISIFNQKPKE